LDFLEFKNDRHFFTQTLTVNLIEKTIKSLSILKKKQFLKRLFFINGKWRQQKQTNESVVLRHSLHPQAAHALFTEGEKSTS
jgi:hypothetical protein